MLQYSLNAQNPVDESTPEGEGFYQQDLTPDDDIHVNEIIRANEVDEDLENYILESTHQTRGQNYMLSSWLRDHSAQYCETLFEAEHISSEESSCAGCAAASSLYKCRNCHSDALLCKTCIVNAHSALPTHRIRMWTGQFFQDETLSGLGAVLHLGHGGRKCTNGHDWSLYFGSTNGFHFINVRYCRHPGADKDSHQLLAVKIFPCSDSAPGSAFTFDTLKQFQLLPNDSLLSAHRYYNVLVRLTNNAFPHVPDPRYQEFLRVARQWELLQQQKCIGASSAPSEPGSMAMRCPACPRAGVNYELGDVQEDSNLYMYQLSYDGNFHLVRKNKSFDEHDTCASNGMQYFVDQARYKDYLKQIKDSAYAQNSKEANCNNHTAAKNTWVHLVGLAETGIGAVICARHSIFMAGGTVNYFKGERFAYTDYAVATVLHTLKEGGVKDVGFFYDIYCHWVKNWWARAGEIPHPLGLLYVHSFAKFLGGIPKFHLAGHTDSCYVQYSLNNTSVIGRLDAEGGERCWAQMNHAAGSTSEKGPGSRIDALNSIMDHWNWSKCVEMVSHLVKKWQDTLKMARSQRELFNEYCHALEPATIRRWESCSIKPQLVDGVYQSPFVLQENKDASISHKLKAMLDQEMDTVKTTGYPVTHTGSAEWIVIFWTCFITKSMSRERLKIYIKELGGSPTDTQILSVATQRKSLLQRIQLHDERSVAFVGSQPPQEMTNTQDSIPGEPETFHLKLPSRFQQSSIDGNYFKTVLAQEKEPRVVVCMKSLQLICSLICQKAHVLGAKGKHAKSQKTSTWSQTLSSRLNLRLSYEKWRYENSHKYLLLLGAKVSDVQHLKELRATEIQDLLRILSRKRELGDQNISLPWFWTILFDKSTGLTTEQQYQENIKVEWFLACERYKRWDVEILWLKREATSVIFDFEHRRCSWAARAEDAQRSNRLGLWAYCNWQAHLWSNLREDTVQRTLPMLEACF
ncbi:hypothetical protein BDV93DRAFT_564544 [Ceratobasidium sp. AG-I]|nr:hypothetical protein BDV93DRAFT_564544 [Ceratobasidium sp. AG-I]